MGWPEVPRVLLIEDHALFRDGVKMLLREELGDEAQIVEATGCEEVLNQPREPEPDLILMDLGLPGLGGTEGLRVIRRTWPDSAIVVMSAHDDVETIKIAIGAGAQGYIPKSANSQEMLTALRLVRSGGRYVPPYARDALPAMTGPTLTTRQHQVLACLVQGMTNRMIGQHLGMAENTVRVHVSAILNALGANNRTEAVRLAMDLGLLDPEQ